MSFKGLTIILYISLNLAPLAYSNSNSPKNLDLDLPPVLPLVLENNIINLIETSFFLNHSPKKTYRTFKTANSNWLNGTGRSVVT